MRKIGRIIFSRYAISAIIIIVEVLLMTCFFIKASSYTYLAVILTFVVDILAIAVIINSNANPEYKVSWIAVVALVPILGVLLYVLFYRRRMTKREERFLKGLFNQINNCRLEDGSIDRLDSVSPMAMGKARAIMHDDAIANLYTGTSSKFYPSGEEYFEDLICDLERAEDFIFIQYFIIGLGDLWDRIHLILKEKAGKGVDVRVLYDDIGCMNTLPHYYEYTLRSEGISAYRFARVSPKVSSVHNNRNHRKICIIDGKVGYTGGVNIADEYVNLKERFGHWKDGGIRLSGNAVRGLIKEFLSLWDYTTRRVSDYERFLCSVCAAGDADGGFYLPFGSGPAPLYKRPAGKNAFLNIINQAKEYIYITTPYLIIDYELTEALCNAALRGVDVKIITPGIADKKIVKVMTKSSYPHLMSSGVQIFEYTPGFIHEKTLVCDGKYAIIGTINFDFRSLVHHFENAVWMYVTPTVITSRDNFLKTLGESERIDRKSSRLSLGEWLIRNIIKLFAPLL